MILGIKEALENATGLPIKALYTSNLENCIVYNYYCELDNGATAQNRLELRLITDTLKNAELYRKKIIEALVETGDLHEKVEGIYECRQNGGGRLYEGGTQMYHTIMYFDVITRSLN